MKGGFWHGKKHLFFVSLYISDVFSYLMSAALAVFFFGLDMQPFHLKMILFILLILIINYSAFNLYKDKRTLFDDSDLMRILYSVFITLFVSIIFMITFDITELILYNIILVTMCFTIVSASLGRFIIYNVIYLFRKAGHDRKKVAFFGTGNADLIEKVRENPTLGYDIIGVAKGRNDLNKLIQKADIIFVSQHDVDEQLLELMIRHNSINWKIISPLFNLVIEPVDFDEFKDYPIINVSTFNHRGNYLAVKRVIDILISGISLILLSPLFAAIAIIIKTTSPKGPVFFTHNRLGKDLKAFRLFKFRTMVPDAESQKDNLEKANEVKGLFKIKKDPRIIPFGRFLRRSCIDELPQLINVFKGDMSIVGPRPHLERELSHFKGWRRARFRIKPGLTGMWQVNGRHELNFDKAVLYDIYYIKHMSFLLDIAIILKTIPAIVFSRGRY